MSKFCQYFLVSQVHFVNSNLIFLNNWILLTDISEGQPWVCFKAFFRPVSIIVEEFFPGLNVPTSNQDKPWSSVEGKNLGLKIWRETWVVDKATETTCLTCGIDAAITRFTIYLGFKVKYSTDQSTRRPTSDYGNLSTFKLWNHWNYRLLVVCYMNSLPRHMTEFVSIIQITIWMDHSAIRHILTI